MFVVLYFFYCFQNNTKPKIWLTKKVYNHKINTKITSCTNYTSTNENQSWLIKKLQDNYIIQWRVKTYEAEIELINFWPALLSPYIVGVIRTLYSLDPCQHPLFPPSCWPVDQFGRIWFTDPYEEKQKWKLTNQVPRRSKFKTYSSPSML